MHTANTHLMLALADTRRNDLERRATKSEFLRFGWLARRTARAETPPRSSAPLNRRKAY